ncbi:hypothetical protein MRX96_040602 [Rhipicephalus microplus]
MWPALPRYALRREAGAIRTPPAEERARKSEQEDYDVLRGPSWDIYHEAVLCTRTALPSFVEDHHQRSVSLAWWRRALARRRAPRKDETRVPGNRR